MNNIIKYDKNNLPRFQYLNEKNNLEIIGNVISQNLYDRISTVGEIYALDFTGQLSDDIKQFAIDPDTEETLENTVSIEVLPEISQIFSLLAAAGSLQLGISTFISILLAKSLNVNINNVGGEVSLENFREALKKLPAINRFTGHKIDLISFDLDNNYVYALTDCEKYVNRVKLIKYYIDKESLISEDKKLEALQYIYNQKNLYNKNISHSGYNFNTYCVGELTSYAKINVNNNYIIKIDGHSNDYGTFSNVKSVAIYPTVDSSLHETTINDIELSMAYKGTTEEGNVYIYHIERLTIYPEHIGILKKQKFIKNNAYIRIGDEQYVSMANLPIIMHNDKEYFDISGIFPNFDYIISHYNISMRISFGESHIYQDGYDAGQSDLQEDYEYGHTPNPYKNPAIDKWNEGYDTGYDIYDIWYEGRENNPYNTEEMLNLHDVWNDGYSLGFADEMIKSDEHHQNPHETGTDEYNAWEEGYAYGNQYIDIKNPYDANTSEYTWWNEGANTGFSDAQVGQPKWSSPNPYDNPEEQSEEYKEWQAGYNDGYNGLEPQPITPSIPDDTTIWFHFDQIGRSLISYTDHENIHEGTYNYTIPQDTSTQLTIQYLDYITPNIGITTGCLIKGTKITMADGSLKTIEDIQIGDYILGSDEKPHKVFWNQPMKHQCDDHYTLYKLPDGKELGVIADERIYWNNKFQYISCIPEITSERINGNYKPYEIWVSGDDSFYANGILCGKIYSNIKCKPIRWLMQQFYRLLFLHKKDYKLINKIHDFIGQKILKHNPK